MDQTTKNQLLRIDLEDTLEFLLWIYSITAEDIDGELEEIKKSGEYIKKESKYTQDLKVQSKKAAYAAYYIRKALFAVYPERLRDIEKQKVSDDYPAFDSLS